jgi:hypothetical protein
MITLRNIRRILCAGGVIAGLTLVAGQAQAAASLWFGNDGAGTDYHTTTSGALLGTVSQSLTGAAWDGSTLYLGDPAATIFTDTLAGVSKSPVSFTIPVLGGPAEDMAWDSKRNQLVRVFHTNGTSGEIEIFTKTGTVISSFALPTTDPTGTLTGTMGALGVAYDSTRDQLDISYCNVGCGAPGGVIEAYDPVTLAFLGTVFTSSTEYLGGLGYQRSTDTLWVGGFDPSFGYFVEHAMRDGTVLSRFGSAVFPDGLEFVSVPEPATWAVMLVGVTGLGASLRRRRSAQARAA